MIESHKSMRATVFAIIALSCASPSVASADPDRGRLVEPVMDAGLGLAVYPIGSPRSHSALDLVVDAGALARIDSTGRWRLGGSLLVDLSIDEEDLVVAGRVRRRIRNNIAVDLSIGVALGRALYMGRFPGAKAPGYQVNGVLRTKLAVLWIDTRVTRWSEPGATEPGGTEVRLLLGAGTSGKWALAAIPVLALIGVADVFLDPNESH